MEPGLGDLAVGDVADHYGRRTHPAMVRPDRANTNPDEPEHLGPRARIGSTVGIRSPSGASSSLPDVVKLEADSHKVSQQLPVGGDDPNVQRDRR
jgi:hypothetical protein